MTHIKRDGSYLCKLSTARPKFLMKRDGYIKFSDAHSLPDLRYGYCSKCVEKYYQILKKPEVVVIIK
jgi:hypothetical protein